VAYETRRPKPQIVAETEAVYAHLHADVWLTAEEVAGAVRVLEDRPIEAAGVRTAIRRLNRQTRRIESQRAGNLWEYRRLPPDGTITAGPVPEVLS